MSPAAGEDDSIRQLVRIPLPALAAGSYTIRIAHIRARNVLVRVTRNP